MPRRPITILIADDFDELRTVLAEVFESRGWRVTAARNGVEAVSLAVRQTPDVVLMDLSMPELDGFGSVARMRQHALLRRIPFIAMSAHATDEIRLDAIAAGFDVFVVKPFEPDDLIALIESRLPLDG